MDEARHAQAAAERFVKIKAKKYLNHFMTDTRLMEVMPNLLEIMRDEHTANLLRGADPLPYALNVDNVLETMSYVFGRWVAMAYAVGWTEALENRADRRRKLKLVTKGPTDDQAS